MKKIIPVSEVANLKRPKYFPLKKGKIEIVPVQLEELDPILDKYFKVVFPSMASTSPAKLSKKQKANRESLFAEYRKLHWECFFFKYEGKIVGWFMGEMDDNKTFYMRNTGILPKFQGKKIYSLFFPRFLEYLEEIGYERVSSHHSPNNGQIFHLKLKYGFMIVGSETHEVYGQLIKMIKIFDKKQNEAFIKRYC
ncbi:MAG: GNAT family N-acetyltransferase [Bacteriovorax sp.]|nr:GNAT family N-acetyltransferase [Bacteriovorax sp.]